MKELYNKLKTSKKYNGILYHYCYMEYSSRNIKIQKMIQKTFKWYIKKYYNDYSCDIQEYYYDFLLNLYINISIKYKLSYNINISNQIYYFIELILKDNTLYTNFNNDYINFEIFIEDFLIWLFKNNNTEKIFNYFKNETLKEIEFENVNINKKNRNNRIFQLINKNTYEEIICYTYNEVKEFCKKYNIPNYRKFIKEYTDSKSSYYNWFIASKTI
jgi:hypothetical protein